MELSDDRAFVLQLDLLPEPIMGWYSKQRKIALLLYGLFEQLFASGAIYGWVALLLVLKEEGYFGHLCSADRPTNATESSKFVDCRSQSERLNLVYTIAVVLSGVVIVLVGVLIDKHGPRAARHIGSLLLAASGIFWFFSTTAQSILLFPAVVTFALAGVFWTAAWMQVGALVYQNEQSTVICLLSAAYDASAVMLLIIKILHGVQKTLTINQLMCGYCGIITITSIVATLTIIPSRKSVQEDLDEQILQIGIDRVRQMSIRSFGGAFDDVFSPTLMPPIEDRDEAESNQINKLILNGEVANGNLLHPDTAIYPKAREPHRGAVIGLPAAELEYLQRKMKESGKSETLRLIFSSTYLWHLAFSSLVILRINFYVSSFDSLTSWLSHGDRAVVDQYTNAFGIFQFFGALFAPVMGPYLDGKLCMKADGKNEKRAKLLRCALALAITNTVALVLAAAVVTPVLEVQYLAMLSQVILRGFFFAVHFSYVAEAFPSKHYGKLSCLALLVAVIIGSLQYPLFIAIERSLNGNPFWINIGLLVVTLALYGQPLHLKRTLKLRDGAEV